MNNLEGRIEHQLTAMVQEKFDLLIRKVETGELIITSEFMSFARLIYQLGYQEGKDDTFVQMKEIYFDDPDFFMEMFEKEEVDL